MLEAVKDTFQADKIDEEETRRARAAYFAAVDYLDEVIGDLLSTLGDEGLLENTVVVYLSDHGELAGEHGHWWKHSWFESSVRVPWHLELPEHRRDTLAPTAIETPVSLMDLYPTLCGLLDVEVPGGLDGVDLSEAIVNESEPDRGPVVCDNFSRLWGDDLIYRMVIDGDYKYVQFNDAPEILSYIDSNPHETTNLAVGFGDTYDDVLDRLRRIADSSLDFETLLERRAADEAFSEDRSLPIPQGTGNIFHLPDGRLVDMGSVLYRPSIITDDPSAVFSDWPQNDE
jgi:choline-sulfatase